jgi:tetratricopeptide (TPR) repeat protein
VTKFLFALVTFIAYCQASAQELAPIKKRSEPLLQAPMPSAIDDDPLLLHADAMLAEVDGRPDDALRLLKRAFERDPTDDLIAYDLLRVAKTYGGPQAQRDLVGYLQIVPNDAKSHARLGTLLLQLGQRGAAKKQMRLAFRDDPDSAEALQLKNKLEGKQQTQSASAVQVQTTLAAGAQYDTNVSVLRWITLDWRVD